MSLASYLNAFAARVHSARYHKCESLDVEARKIARIAVQHVLHERRLESDIVFGVRHPLGFIRFPLTEPSPTLPRINLHLWLPERGTPYREDIHDHCYDFFSFCIMGALQHELFEISDRADGFLVSTTQYGAGSCEDPSGTTGNLRVSPVGLFTVRALECYHFSHTWLHRAAPCGNSAVSLQVQSPYVKQNATVLRDAGGGEPSPTRQNIPNHLITEVLEAAVANI